MEVFSVIGAALTAVGILYSRHQNRQQVQQTDTVNALQAMTPLFETLGFCKDVESGIETYSREALNKFQAYLAEMDVEQTRTAWHSADLSFTENLEMVVQPQLGRQQEKLDESLTLQEEDFPFVEWSDVVAFVQTYPDFLQQLNGYFVTIATQTKEIQSGDLRSIAWRTTQIINQGDILTHKANILLRRGITITAALHRQIVSGLQ